MRTSLASLALGVLIAAAMFAVMPAGASANTYGAATLLDVASNTQFDTADSSVISANGRFVAFRGSVDGQIGIWRRDLQTGAIDPVAVGLPVPTGASAYDPQAPSVSADGQYIAFNTQATLDPTNDIVCDGAIQSGCRSLTAWQVYVRDMSAPADGQPVYTLASAVNGSTKSLTYSPDAGGSETGSRIAGGATGAATDSQFASPGRAITADGRTVVFSVDSESNLANPASINTPPQQVAVRNLDTHMTTLVSLCQEQQYCAPGATAVSWHDNSSGSNGGAVTGDAAVISADGTTVAWLSQFDALQQETRTLNGEQYLYGEQGIDRQAVWRRIAQYPGAQIDHGAATYRITGEADPMRTDCPATTVISSTNPVPPAACKGPLEVSQAFADGFNVASQFSHLALSADGYKVVLLSGAPLVGAQHEDYEAYLVNMHPGLTRDQATTALTQAGGLVIGASPPKEGDIVADAISADGNAVSLTTTRVRFDLMNPFYIGPARTNAAAAPEVYTLDVHDLQNMTLDLATYAYNGTFATSTVAGFTLSCGGLSPSLSSDGSLLAFDSCDSNLVWGDGNGSSNVYAEQRLSGGGAGDPAPNQKPGASLAPSAVTPAWVIHATASSLADGNVRLYVLVPGAGRVRVRVRARLPASRGHRRVSRVVATASISVRGAGLTSGIVHLGRAYLKLARNKGGLHASAQLTFTVSGSGQSLGDTLAVRFQAKPKRAAKRAPRHGRTGQGNR